MQGFSVPRAFYVVLFAIFILASLREQRLFADGSFFRHLASGRELLSGGVQLTPASSLWTTPKASLSVTWIADLLFALTASAAPLRFAVIFQGLMAALGALVVFGICRKAGASDAGSIVGAVVFSILSHCLWRIGPNSWLIGLVPIAVCYAQKGSARGLIGMLLTVFLLLNTTDIGINFLRLIYGVGGSDPVIVALTDWRTPNYHTFPELALGFAGLMALLLFASAPIRRSWFLYLVISAALSFVSVQFQIFFAIAAGVIAAIKLSPLLARSPLINSLSAQHGGRWSSGAFAIFLLLALLPIEKMKRSDLEGRVGPFVPALRQLIDEGNEHGFPVRLFNDAAIGGELAWSGLKAFADDRSIPVIGDYADLVLLNERWEGVLSRWRLNVALLRRESSLAGVLREREGWRIVAEGPSIPRLENGRPMDFGLVLLAAPTIFEEANGLLAAAR